MNDVVVFRVLASVVVATPLPLRLGRGCHRWRIREAPGRRKRRRRNVSSVIRFYLAAKLINIHTDSSRNLLIYKFLFSSIFHTRILPHNIANFGLALVLSQMVSSEKGREVIPLI